MNDLENIQELIRKMAIAIDVGEFIRGSVVGGERALYRVMADKSNHEQLKLIAATGISKYYTSIYNSIIRRDDPYVNARFDSLHQKSGHSYHCLALKMGYIALNATLKLDRSKIKDLSLSEYTENIECQLRTLVNLDVIYQDLQHSCTGAAVSEMTPFPKGKLMYTFR